MKIRMLNTRAGSPDGLTVVVYQKDRSYDLPRALAEVFLAEGWARRATPPRAARSKAGQKNLGSAPENKTAKKTVAK